ncbi:type II toxin-antitoxin system RelE/ParE family toxin [Aerococcaceae bacterium zg-ZUI334]|uniref:type II toxin-antitoxin system RelE/ParE family toxin n=1 Tax=Aerococcaceae bacterium zg-252 TaxID=2796928 RepID=UPI001B993476|nr:type II toxin-antitoxin system RelE/ParE family toxin [Aerococcaceae bacterium zg-ZUI334]
MKNYTLDISPRVVEQIKSIRRYIADVKLSPATADKVAESIFEEISSLVTFPERGFDADQKLGVKIDKEGDKKTYGIVILERKYILLYSINEDDLLVEVSYLFSTKTNYAKIFL